MEGSRNFATLLWEPKLGEGPAGADKGGNGWVREGKAARVRIISTYVFRQAAGTTLMILATLSGIVWIALALRQLNVVTSQGQDTLTLIKMTTLALPNLMAIIAPFSFLIASLQTLNRLNTDSELIVVAASGAKIWTIGRPLLLIAALLTVLLLLVNNFVQPWSMRVLRDYIVQVRTDLLTQVIQPGRFSSPESNLMFHIRERALNGELIGLVMHDTRDKTQAQSYLAERGTIVKQDGTAFLVMSAGHIIRRSDKLEAPQIVAFDRYVVDLDQFEPQDSTQSELKPRERYFSELAFPDPNSPIYKQQPGLFRSELHERFSSALYPLAFALIAIAFVGQARSTRSSRMESLFMAFAIAAGARLAGLAVNNFVARNSAFLPLLYLLPIGTMVLALIVIRGADRQRSGLAVIDTIVERLAPIGQWLKSLVARKPAAGAGV